MINIRIKLLEEYEKNGRTSPPNFKHKLLIFVRCVGDWGWQPSKNVFTLHWTLFLSSMIFFIKVHVHTTCPQKPSLHLKRFFFVEIFTKETQSIIFFMPEIIEMNMWCIQLQIFYYFNWLKLKIHLKKIKGNV